MGIFGKIFFGSEAEDNFNEAKKTNELAEFIVDDARDTFDNAKESCEASLKILDNKKQNIFKGSLSKFVKNFSKVKNVDFTVPKGLKELEKYTASTDLFYPYLTINTSFWESSIVRTIGTAAAGGGLGLIGVAVLRPFIKKKSKIAVDNANANYAQAELVVEQLEAATDVCSYIEARADMFGTAINKLNELFDPLVSAIEKTINQKGTDYTKYSIQERKNFAAAASLASSIKSVLDVAILTKDGTLTQESKQLCLDMADQLQLPCDPDSLGDEESLSDEYNYGDYNDDEDFSDEDDEDFSDEDDEDFSDGMGRFIDADKCVACGSCIGECPVEAIHEGDVYTIDPDVCINCGACEAVCPNEAIYEI